MDESLIIKYVTNEATPEERNQVEVQMKKSSEFSDEVTQLLRYWKDSAEFGAHFNPDKNQAFIRINQKINQKRSFGWTYKIAASILIIFGIGYWVYEALNPMDPEFIRHYANMEMKAIQLPDHSTVWLDQGAELLAPATFTDKSRAVILKGKGYFEVEKDPDRPFKIKSGQSLVEVLGTRFVLDGDNSVTLTLYEGQVAFYPRETEDKKFILTDEGQLIYETQTKKIIQSNHGQQNKLAWKTKKLVFDDTPFIQVLQDLSQTYHIQFHYIEEEIENLTFSGKFDQMPIADILAIIGATLSIEFKISEDEITVIAD